MPHTNSASLTHLLSAAIFAFGMSDPTQQDIEHEIQLGLNEAGHPPERMPAAQGLTRAEGLRNHLLGEIERVNALLNEAETESAQESWLAELKQLRHELTTVNNQLAGYQAQRDGLN